MAGYIIFNDKTEIEFHIGIEVIRKSNWVNKIREIQLDGDELQYVFNNFENLPYPKNNQVVKFYGDMAKFIIGNW